MAAAAAPSPEGLKVIVFDDDPTGSQTLHGCPLLLRWDADTLAAGLRHPSPFLFLLTNTRALEPASARLRLRSIAAALRPVLEQAEAEGVIRRWLVVSRGDSTLRGHFPLELEEIAAALGPFDASLLVPAFLEGGRTTVAGVHRLQERPVHETAFARDSLFGYSTSYLPDWVAEKSGGRLPASRVERLDLAELEQGSEALVQRLRQLIVAARRSVPSAAVPPASVPSAAVPSAAAAPAWQAGPVVAVDASGLHHLAVLGDALREVLAPGPLAPPPRILFQSAASLLNALAPLPPPALGPAGLAALRRRRADGRPAPGLVVVGSHVPLADRQLARLLADPACRAVELPVATLQRLLEEPLAVEPLAALEQACLKQLEGALAAGLTPVLHTSRGERHGRDAAERRRLGLGLAAAMARLVGRLAPRLGYVISKGGITTQTLLSEGLELAAVELQGQLLPGVSVVLAPARRGGAWGGSPAALDLPVVTLPGNLGDDGTLVSLWRRLEAHGCD